MTERDADTLPESRAFEVLSSPRRRYVLYVLAGRDGRMKLNEVAEQIAAWENGASRAAVTNQQRKRVYVSLYQTHVPALAAAGVVAYDEEMSTITRAEHAGDIERYLGVTGASGRWPRYYLGLTGASVLFAGVVAFVGLPASVVALVVVGSFGALAVVHAVSLRGNGDALGIPPEIERPER